MAATLTITPIPCSSRKPEASLLHSYLQGITSNGKDQQASSEGQFPALFQCQRE